MQEQTDSTFSTIGYVDTIDNKRSGNPMRVQIRNVDTGQSRWFSTFDKNVVAVMTQAGDGSGPWQLSYTEKAAQWKDKDTGELRTGVNLTIQTAILQGQPAQPAPPPPPPPRDEVAPNWLAVKDIKKGQAVPNNPDWVTKLDVTGRSIIRQVAFKAAVAVQMDENSETHSEFLDVQLMELTDIYETILLGTFEPDQERLDSLTPPTDDQFIQQEF